MKFLVCYDNSDLSRHVVKEAQRHAAVWNAELEIVQVLLRDKPIKHATLLEMEGQLDAEIQRLFKGVDIPFNVQLEVDDLDIGLRILDLAEKKNVDLIFLGLKKQSRVGKLIFGSNAQYIILKSAIPVVTVNRSAGHRD